MTEIPHKRPRGRPVTIGSKRRAYATSDATHAALVSLGDGNASQGIRNAVACADRLYAIRRSKTLMTAPLETHPETQTAE